MSKNLFIQQQQICSAILLLDINMSTPPKMSIYEQFHSKIRAKFKKERQERKQNLRQIQCKKIVQSSQGSNDQQFIKKTMKRGNKWWNKINRYYFQKISNQYIDCMRQFTTSQHIMEFGSQVCPLFIYYQQIICNNQPSIFQDDSIRVIFRLQHKIKQTEKHILAGFLCSPFSNIQKEQIPSLINYNLPNFYSFHPTDVNLPKITVQDQIQNQSRYAEIYLSSFTQNEEYITKCLRYQTIFRDEEKTQIQKQIECWENQLEQQHKTNVQKWSKFQLMIQQQNKKFPQISNIQQRIEEIKKMLIKSQTFSYFRLGYSDKNIQEYQKARQFMKQSLLQQQIQGNNSSPFFQTDCKVCFCTRNQPSNKVIYCDECNTSFHQSCYGIQSVDQQKQIICDVCSYLKKSQNDHRGGKSQFLTCQICGRGKFPIKCIDQHFYHVSCLVLFDFAQIHEFQISLKSGVTHKKIMQAVIENEMEHDYCQFCGKHSILGMQLNCSFPLCAKSFHPICAYLNGCLFDINRRINGGIDVKVECRDHRNPDFNDLIHQIFVRRFLCNYKNTAKIDQQSQFKEIYLKQLQKVAKNLKQNDLSDSGMKKILKFKMIKSFSQQLQKGKPQLQKKSQSNISAGSSNSANKNQKDMHKTKKNLNPQQKKTAKV